MLELSIKEAGYYQAGFGASRNNPIVILKSIDLKIEAGSIVALVGESGSGKSTLGLCAVGLLPYAVGEFHFDGIPYRPDSMDHLRDKIQFIFQDPFSALNPRLTIGQTYREILQRTDGGRVSDAAIESLLSHVELSPEIMEQYPHELSGGQCQRANIGRALAVTPKILICDEIVSALDVSVQAKILNLLTTLKNTLHLGILFTTHDLHVVKHFADEVIILDGGIIIERGKPGDVFNQPQQPYTTTLVQSAYGLQNG